MDAYANDDNDVFVGTAADAGVVGILLTADTCKRDAEIKLLLDRTTDEIAQIQTLLPDVLHIGGHLVTGPLPADDDVNLIEDHMPRSFGFPVDQSRRPPTPLCIVMRYFGSSLIRPVLRH